MEFPEVTAITAGFIGLLQYLLTVAVGSERFKRRLNYGDGGDPELLAKIRRHGNLAENSAIILVLMALLELAGTSANIMWGFGGLFLVARLSHAIGLSGGPVLCRMLGATGTLLVGFGTSGLLLWCTLIA